MSQAKEASGPAEGQEGDSDVETALAALAGESDIDLEETDVHEMLLAYKESGQLRGAQRTNRGYRPVTGRTQWRETLSSGGATQHQRADLTYTLPHLSREGTLGTRMFKQRETSAQRR